MNFFWDVTLTHFSLHDRLRPDGFRVIPRGIHACLQILICLLLPMRQIAPFLSSSRPCIIAFHVGEAFAGNAISNKLPFGKYFAFRILAHKLSGNSMRRLPRQESLIKNFKVPESQATMSFAPCEFLPSYSVGFSLIVRFSPPIFPHHTVEFLTKRT